MERRVSEGKGEGVKRVKGEERAGRQSVNRVKRVKGKMIGGGGKGREERNGFENR